MYKLSRHSIPIVFLWASWFVSALYSVPLATFDGGFIEDSDVVQEGAIALYEIETQKESLKQQILYSILKDKLLNLEKKSTGKNKQQLIIDFMDKNYDTETAKSAKNYFTESTDQTIDQENNEALQIRYSIENKYIISLIKKYNVTFHITRPIPPSINIETKNQPYWGKDDAKVTVVEFSDFECPYCQKMQGDIQKIKAKYSDKIKWVFIDFPLEFHKNAILGHIGARCAADQGMGMASQKKYFDLQQLLFQNSRSLDQKTIHDLAESLKLNVSLFDSCLTDKDEKKKNTVEQNVNYGKKLGISGTPTLFINGKYYPGMLEYKELEEIIEREL